MTTLDRHRSLQDILGQLDSVYLRRRVMRIVVAAVAFVTVVLATLLVTAPAAGYWPDQPPAVLRWLLLGGSLLAWAAAAFWYVARALLWRQNSAQTARFIEQAMPELHNDLINSVLLADDKGQSSAEMVEMAIREAARRSRRVDVHKSVSMRSLRRWGAAAAAAAVMLAAFVMFQPGPARRGLLAVLQPRRYIPTANTIQLVSLAPGDKTIFAGEHVTIVASVLNETADPLDGEVIIEEAKGPRTMAATQGYSVFTCPLGQRDETFRYAVRIGRSRWPETKPYYTVTVVKRIDVQGLDIRYDYPPYTHLESRTVQNADGNIEAPTGSEATVTLRLSSPVPSAAVQLEGGPTRAMSPSADRQSFSAVIPVNKDGAYRLILRDSRGQALQQLPEVGNSRPIASAYGAAGQVRLKGLYRIHAVPDAPPKIQFVSPNRDVSLPPGATLEMKIKVWDKYGLTDMSLLHAREGDAEGFQKVKDFPTNAAAGKKKTTVTYRFKIGPPYKKNDVVTYYATVTDNRRLAGAGGQESRSSQFKILVQDAAEVAAKRARRYDQLQKRLMAILNMQLTQRVNTQICRERHTKVAQVVATAKQVVAGQQRIRKALLDLAEKFPFSAEMVTIQQAVALLANNEAQVAIDQAQVLAAVMEFGRRGRPCGLLARTQDKIIDTLQTLLAIMRSMAGAAERRHKSPGGPNLPPEMREKVAKLASDLDKFIDSQQKAIEAAKRLAKKPVDAFTAEDEKLLKELINTEDEWEKFLNEKFSDFSKLAQQDFSNPAMLKELVAVKCDVTMAKDALKKKAIEIATAIEDNGIENAKTLTANLEKWLPDEPDRIKWSMEDPAGGQDNVEQAELPTELEDLVGDLLEQEEDLFDEMDDISSKYTMSGDKGIGWDAMDGPIANMNAQGVTGNQLPNTNEMGGRSGEGRQGKSSGEFVEDKAVGKGGRRTPTRLGPEPFQKGQVNDVSTEPPGGATGGGKVSGAGEEGLEGPVPPPLQKEMKRLAGKQAMLLQKIQRFREKFKVNDYTNFRFLQAITLMNRVKSDLDNYRYHNALRVRHLTLGAIRQTRVSLASPIDVQADTSAGMPKYVRDEIADAMKGALPEEYRAVLEQYYRRLSEQSR